jgi:hypothetical protein
MFGPGWGEAAFRCLSYLEAISECVTCGCISLFLTEGDLKV